MDSITRENCRLFLAVFIEDNDTNTRRLAKSIGCPEPTLTRIISGVTVPSGEMLKQTGLLLELGLQKYEKLSDAEKETLSETLGTIGGGVLGFGAITTAINSLGLAGLSAAGVTSGLAALGALVGGGMVAGVSVAAAIPLAVGGTGYAIIRAVKYFVGERQLDKVALAPKWESPPGPAGIAP